MELATTKSWIRKPKWRKEPTTRGEDGGQVLKQRQASGVQFAAQGSIDSLLVAKIRMSGGFSHLIAVRRAISPKSRVAHAHDVASVPVAKPRTGNARDGGGTKTDSY